ncbi:hypothetical protein [Microbulbifer hainanensis]|uniref:hypothetical protein n=1 Tax=Microbulbifer hainanensis TaxID=2735675 RepID=UPI0018662E5F|nr:hypothetical protein [Microbulbifer hainanensis]
MSQDNIYSAPQAEVTRNSEPKKRSKLLIAFSILLVVINGFLTVPLIRIPEALPQASAQGYVIGQLSSVILIPFLIVGLFQIGKGFRNPASRVKVFFWASVVILLSKFGNLLTLLQSQ